MVFTTVLSFLLILMMARKLRSWGHLRNHRAGREYPPILREAMGKATVVVMRVLRTSV